MSEGAPQPTTDYGGGDSSSPTRNDPPAEAQDNSCTGRMGNWGSRSKRVFNLCTLLTLAGLSFASMRNHYFAYIPLVGCVLTTVLHTSSGNLGAKISQWQLDRKPRMKSCCGAAWCCSFFWLIALSAVGIICLATAPETTLFPERCNHVGCTRVTRSQAQRGDTLSPIVIDPATKAIYAPRFVDELLILGCQPDVTGVSDTLLGVDFLLHATCQSKIWGFVDDVFVSFSSGTLAPTNWTNSTEVIKPVSWVEAHSELRLGADDMGVNEKRLQALWAAVLATPLP